MSVRKSRALLVVAVGVLGVVLLPSAAFADVTVQPSSLPKGASDVPVGFAVPNESTSGASTVKLEIDFPTATPLLDAHAEAIAGWTSAVEMAQLPKPITTDDGTITQAISKVTWTATGAGIGPDEYLTFNVLVGTVPSKGNQVVFKAIQTYSDGTTVNWIEPIVKGTPDPEHPNADPEAHQALEVVTVRMARRIRAGLLVIVLLAVLEPWRVPPPSRRHPRPLG